MNDFGVSCRLLARACIWCVVFSLAGSAMFVFISLTTPTSLWHLLIFVGLSPTLLAICLVLWAVSRVMAFVETQSTVDTEVSESANYGGAVAMACAVFCVLYCLFAPLALFSITMAIGGS